MGYKISPITNNSTYATGALKLFKENLLLWTDDRFKWFYQENTLGEPITLVALTDDKKEVVGSASAYQRIIYINNKKRKILIAVDFNVKKQYRVFGPSVQLQKELLQYINLSDYDFILAAPSKTAEGIFKRVGYISIGNIIRFSKHLNTSRKVNKKIKSKIIAKIISKSLDTIFLLIDKFLILFIPKYLHVDDNQSFDMRYEQLCTSSLNNFNSIKFEKSIDYLRWRFSGSTGLKFNVMTIINTSRNELLGYVVYTIEKDNQAVIWDFCVGQRELILKYLLLNLANKLRKDNIETLRLECFNGECFENTLKKAFFIKTKTDNHCMIFLNPKLSDQLSEIYINDKLWCVNRADLDL